MSAAISVRSNRGPRPRGGEAEATLQPRYPSRVTVEDDDLDGAIYDVYSYAFAATGSVRLAGRITTEVLESAPASLVRQGPAALRQRLISAAAERVTAQRARSSRDLRLARGRSWLRHAALAGLTVVAAVQAALYLV